jgi:hypothetical protein
MNFEDAEYVPNATAGRTAEPNPYTEVVTAIAGKEKDGKPVAKSFVLEFDGGTINRAKAVAKVTRQLKAAGKNANVGVTVREQDVMKGPKGKETVASDRVRIVFWTGKLVTRTRKPKADK